MVDLMHHNTCCKSSKFDLLGFEIFIKIMENNPCRTNYQTNLSWYRKTCLFLATHFIACLNNTWVDHSNHSTNLISIWCLRAKCTSNHSKIDSCLGSRKTNSSIIRLYPFNKFSCKYLSLFLGTNINKRACSTEYLIITTSLDRTIHHINI